MKSSDRIDPECRESLDAFLEAVPGGLSAISDIGERRKATEALMEAAKVPSEADVEMSEHSISTADKTASLSVRTYRPRSAAGKLPALVFIHGGGLCVGSLDGEEFKCEAMCEALNLVVVSLDYRKAPEHPYPAAPEDCYSGLLWLVENAESLQIEVENVGVYGGSAGGGLALAIALMARDRAGPAIKYIMSVYPMIDDRNETSSSCEILDVGVWDRAANVEAWSWYLAGEEADEYAAPARAVNLNGLPPTFIDVGEVDLFRDEAVDFASRLMRAGVTTELHVYTGAYHGSEVFAPEAVLSRQILDVRFQALRRFIDQ